MHRIFIPIYHFFKSHKVLMYLIMAISFLVFLFFGLKVKYEEDITKLLPTSSVESQLAFTSIGLKDKIFIQVTSSNAEEPLSPEELGYQVDELADMLFEQDTATHYIANILYRLEPEVGLNALDFVLEHVPSFVDTSAYAKILQAIQPEAIESRMQLDYDLMMEDETGDVTQMLAYDPLNLTEAVLGDMLNSSVSGLNIIDGHFFCADSTVCLAYLAPGFYSLDSKTATFFVNRLNRSVKAFDASHPEVRVYLHGDTIGSVSNSSRIRSDLAITVGISLILILVRLGFCFRSSQFIWKMLLPIVYGMAFSLACIYWIKGGMSLMHP